MKTIVLLPLLGVTLGAQVDATHQVRSLRVEILSTMLTSDDGIGEWGFSAVVEADGHRILFDTGARPDTVLNNAKELGVDLSNITEVVLSHNHSDHTGGLITLRRAMRQKNPAALSQAYVGKGIFAARRSGQGKPLEFMVTTKRDYEALGGRFIENDHPVELWQGVWLTGPVPRKYPERNWSGKTQIQTAEGWKEDNIPEDMSLVINTGEGLVVVSGLRALGDRQHAGVCAVDDTQCADPCGHRGLSSVPAGRRETALDRGQAARVRARDFPRRALHRH